MNNVLNHSPQLFKSQLQDLCINIDIRRSLVIFYSFYKNHSIFQHLSFQIIQVDFLKDQKKVNLRQKITLLNEKQQLRKKKQNKYTNRQCCQKTKFKNWGIQKFKVELQS
ncbi:unnamed protein product [Paramecium octaurelia]|uniref:Uncharacterized protein n=1 Tax=Paramecium octaurelia TaxID=43137 RepID=A0A8S1Y0Z8_PAROT|nr:unnamed protein product [Paramecium octaurelia]